MSLFKKHANADAAVINLLKLSGVNINAQDITDELEKHPDYPSALAISDVLNWFGVDNDAYHVSVDELPEVPTPFIAHTTRNNDLVVVSKIAGGQVTLSDEKKSGYSLSLTAFNEIYNGIVLASDMPAGSVSGDKQTWPDRLLPYKIPAALLGLTIAFISILFAYTNFTANLTWPLALLTLFKTAGVVTSILLLIQSINKNNPLVQTLCGGGGKTNCKAILTSKAATVFKGLSWSEVGFFYFAGTWLALLFGGGSTGLLQTLAIMNILSLPYTVYSINYQARIAKQWCVLCTIVQGLLWLEFLPLVGFLKLPMHISEWSILSFMILAVVPLAGWMLIKPLFLKSQQLKTLKNQLRKFKYNTEFFETSLKEQPKYAIPSDEWSIVLGNTQANTIITMASNPYCPPCAKTHQELDRWLNKLDEIQLRIVFTADNEEDDIQTPVARHLMALNAQKDKVLVKQALHDWYEQKQKNYEHWAAAYPVELDESKFNILEEQNAWCKIAEIRSTPTLLINGYRLPQAYRLHDIKYMLQ